MRAFPSSQEQTCHLGSERRGTSARSGGEFLGRAGFQLGWRKPILSIWKRTARRSSSEKTGTHNQALCEERKSEGTKTELTTSPTFSSGGELWMQRRLQLADLKRKSRDPWCIIGPIVLSQWGESTAGVSWPASNYCCHVFPSPLLFATAQSL